MKAKCFPQDQEQEKNVCSCLYGKFFFLQPGTKKKQKASGMEKMKQNYLWFIEDYAIFYIGKSIESTKKLLELIN